MNDQIAFAVAVGGRHMAEKTKFLVESLRAVYPSAPILTYVTNEEKPTLERNTIDFFQNHSTLRTGGFPNSSYPISSKLKAMSVAAQEFNFDYLILLDSDTLLVDRFGSFLQTAPPADVYMKTVDTVDLSGWEDRSRWEEITSKTEYNLPNSRIVSTVDKRRIFPFYNAGVVVSTSTTFPNDWLELTLSVYNISESCFSDQVALGLLTQKYDSVELSELENYPLPHYTHVPEDTVLIHYHDYNSLTKIKNEIFTNIMRRVGLNDKISRRAQFLGRFHEPHYQPSATKINAGLRILKNKGIAELSQKVVRWGIGEL